MKLSFKKSILLIILAAILVQVGIQAYYIQKIARNSTESLAAYADTVLGQIETNLDSTFKNIAYNTTYLSTNTAIRQFLLEEEPAEKYRLRPFVNDAFQSVIATEDQVWTALLFDEKEECVYNYVAMGNDYRKGLPEMRSREKDGSVNPYFVLHQEENGRKMLLCMMPVYENMLALSEAEQQIGTVMLVIRPAEIIRVLEETGNLRMAQFYLLDSREQVLASSTGEELPGERQPGYTYLESNIWGGQGFRIVGRIDNSQVVEEYSLFRNQMLLSCGVMIGLLLAIGTLFNHTIAHPIDRLIGEVAELGNDRRKKQITGKYHFQLTPLVEKINAMLTNNANMSQRIFKTQQQLYETELMKNESELYALRSQINPHFLFNTLQCMGGIALMNDQPVVAKMASYMAEIFRYSIKEGDRVRVSEEVALLRKYLYICDVRFQGRFQWEIQVAEDIQRDEIDKMMLQPLVENAIYHGLEKRTEPGGLLLITGRREGNTLVFEITDNGGHLTQADAGRLTEILSDPRRLVQVRKEKKSIGVVNIQSRLKMLYGEKGGLFLKLEGENTIVTLTVPYKEL